MEGNGSFHGNTWEFPLSVEVEAFIASITSNSHEYISRNLLWASIYTDYHKLPALSTRLRSVCTDFRLIYSHGSFRELPWKLPCKQICFHGSQFTSMEVGGSWFCPWNFASKRSRFVSTAISGSFHGRTWKFTEVFTFSGSISFHCFNQLQLPRTYSVESSMGFHIPIHIYVNLHPRVSKTLQLLPQDQP